jgi:hypothetical protein
MIPYLIQHYEPMHKWKINKKFAYIPKIVWEYEDNSSVINSMVPDDYRVFIRTTTVVWLEEYYEIQGYERNLNYLIKSGPVKPVKFTIEKNYYMMKLLLQN